MVAPVVHLVGPSSSGKTAAARALQRLHPRPLMLLEAGRVLGHGLPQGHPSLDDVPFALAFQDRVSAAYYATIRAFAEHDIPVIGEEAWVDPKQPGALVATLAEVPLRTVLVHCDLPVAEQRERGRQDGIRLGTAREQHERHVTDYPFQLIIDTTTTTPEQAATLLLSLFEQPWKLSP
jgi:chloramphenicol 3-O-phosphotransferase